MAASVPRDAIVRSLIDERLVDIVTTGARSGAARRTEIWITNAGGRIYLCGMPRFKPDGSKQPRDWVANLSRHPDFTLYLKESVQVELTARTSAVTERDEREQLAQSPAAQWYREHSPSLEVMLTDSPMMAVAFTGQWAWLNDPSLLSP